MVIGRKNATPFPALPKPAIAKTLEGEAGYEGYPATVTFSSYLKMLRERGA
jgi:hypothetical protein